MFVAEQFTGHAGQYVSLKQTIADFAEVTAGKHDDKPESAFYMLGSLKDSGKTKETETAKKKS